jgi:large subunit ribosomal protein L25
MAERKTLIVQTRSGFGKGENRRLRGQQMVPGVYYGAHDENIAVQVPALPLTKLFGEVGRTTVFDLEIEDNGKKSVKPSLVWDIQYHPYKRAFTHIDFYGVDLKKDVKITAPIEFTGIARGTKLGGKLETYREKVTLKGKPLSLPNKIVVDVTELDLGKSLHVSDLTLPDGVTCVTPANAVVVSVISREEAEGAEGAPGT